MDKNQDIELFLVTVASKLARLEIIGPHSKLVVIGNDNARIKGFEETTWRGTVGLKLGQYKNVWHWFNFQIGEWPFISFDHSYSQSNGKSKRGYQHRKSVCRSVVRLLKLPPDFLNLLAS